MNILLWANNATSLALVLVCWWLAHQNAGSKERFGRSIAAGYGALATATMANLLFRNVAAFEAVLPISLLISKVVLVASLALAAMQPTMLSGQPHD